MDVGDFGRLAARFNQAGVWSDGDFDYDGVVGINDFALLGGNFNLAVAAGQARPMVPEPGWVGLLAGAAAVRARRRCA